MPEFTELIRQLVQEAQSAVVRIWKRLASIPEYEVQESTVRIPDPRRVAYIRNQLRRSSRSGLDCNRH